MNKVFKQAHAAADSLDLRQVILLDNESTTDLFCNEEFLTDVRRTKDRLRLHSNGGTMKAQRKGTLPGYIKCVWSDQRAITNILALKNVIQQYRVTYDSR